MCSSQLLLLDFFRSQSGIILSFQISKQAFQLKCTVTRWVNWRWQQNSELSGGNGTFFSPELLCFCLPVFGPCLSLVSWHNRGKKRKNKSWANDERELKKERVNTQQKWMKSSWNAAFPAWESRFNKHPLPLFTVLMQIKAKLEGKVGINRRGSFFKFTLGLLGHVNSALCRLQLSQRTVTAEWEAAEENT